MHHLMRRYPIVGKIGSRAFLSDTKPNPGSVPTRSVAAAHSSPETRRDIDPHLLYRIPMIIINDRFRRKLDSIKNQPLQTVGHRRTEHDIDLRARNLKFGFLTGSHKRER